MVKSDERARLLLIDRLSDLAMTIVRVSVPCWAFVRVVESLAGQETIVNVAIEYFSKGGNLVPWAVAGGTSVWAVGERTLRHRKVASMSRHVGELETRIDSKRTSSGLTSEGKTPTKRRTRGE